MKMIIDLYENMREILKKIKNKNALYRKLGLNTTYLNLKNFINGKEPLQDKSKRFLYGYLGYQEIPLMINLEELTDEEIECINKINSRFLNALDLFVENEFKNERGRFTVQDITEDDKEMVKNILNDLNIFIEDSDKNNTQQEIAEEDNDNFINNSKNNSENENKNSIQIEI